MIKSQDIQIIKDNVVREAMIILSQALQKAKPNERSELARRYAIMITDFEKVCAYFECYINKLRNDMNEYSTSNNQELKQ